MSVPDFILLLDDYKKNKRCLFCFLFLVFKDGQGVVSGGLHL